ncbi:platelet endothelial cell adhesion molecule-like isoform X1 [Sinocyclocheilus anshuiensis]|uniref:platelet endothelial cell adhesion molecule-like isoform X1 n=1 Tax=Sinocyclocheilus anshuiensis TaxID=1608454 RepID=UPI0007BA4AE9|nr:PREDICTED: platelet endothelial cell adhesion molecule-like isoform X1 [Sinocyclocheilus anshuiensis]
MSMCLLWLGLLHISLSALWQAANIQAAVTIDQVTLTVLPANNVESGTNVILRCEASVSQSLPQPLTYSFSLLQDSQVMYSKNSSASVVERSLSPARVSNSGRYQCSVHIYNKHKMSNILSLRVTGLQIPVLKVKSDIVSEGEDIIATCSAREETGSLMFYFYEDNQEVKRVVSTSNSVTTTLTMQKLTDIYLHCDYMVMMQRSAGHSNKSNMVKVIVQDLDVITPQISISPKANVVEGDRVQITCKVKLNSDLELYLTKVNTLLRESHTTFTYSLIVRAEDSGDYVCKAEKGSVQKKAVYRLNVAELFSKPILRMSPDQLFEGERFTLTCSSTVISSVKIGKADIKYVLLKDGRRIAAVAKYDDTASLATNGNYYCMAMAKEVNKTSLPFILKAKVPVSAPVLRAVNKVIVGKPFRVSCESENGTFPITYTLLKTSVPVANRTVVEAADRAIFNITSISFPEEIYSFRCQASNHVPSFSKTSEPLRAPVIVPVSRPDLEPKEVTVTEGSDLILICSVHQGTYPITFTWYYNRVKLPSSTQEVRSLEGSYVVKAIERNQRGDYYCEASNYAIETKKSYPARIGVSLALWKKALTGVFCILLLVAIVIVLTVLFKKLSNPRRKKQATELSVKPSRPKSGDPMRISLTLDIEDNTALNGTPCVMGRNVWTENVSGSDSDDHTDEDSELVHPQEVDPRGDVPVKKTTEPEYSVQHTEVQVSTPGVSEQAEGQVALEYAQLNNSEQEPA